MFVQLGHQINQDLSLYQIQLCSPCGQNFRGSLLIWQQEKSEQRKCTRPGVHALNDTYIINNLYVSKQCLQVQKLGAWNSAVTIVEDSITLQFTTLKLIAPPPGSSYRQRGGDSEFWIIWDRDGPQNNLTSILQRQNGQ